MYIPRWGDTLLYTRPAVEGTVCTRGSNRVGSVPEVAQLQKNKMQNKIIIELWCIIQ